MLIPLCTAAAEHDLPIYFFGTSAPVLEASNKELSLLSGGRLRVAGYEAPPNGFDPEGPEADLSLERIARSGARICFVMLGAPKQELLAARAVERGIVCGFIGVGAAADLNAQLISARVEVARLEARRGGSGGRLRDTDSVPEELASPTLRDLRASLSRVSQQKAALEAQMLPGRPAVRVAIDNERKIMSMIDGEVRCIRESSAVELRRARANAVALKKQLETLRGQVNRTNNAQIQLRELEREVEMNRNLFQQAVTRARETTEQARVNTTNVRVI
jgi:hypothetical protein